MFFLVEVCSEVVVLIFLVLDRIGVGIVEDGLIFMISLEELGEVLDDDEVWMIFED